MALNLAVAVKNRALNKAWRESGDDNKIWLSIPGIIGSPEVVKQEAQFNVASGGAISLSAPVMFAVGATTTVNKIWIGTSSANYSNLGRIDLEYDSNPEKNEQVYFDSNGIYAINEITITLVEDN